MMRRRLSARMDLFFPPGEAEAAELVERAVSRSLTIVDERWGLCAPSRCRVYVMTAWLPFVLHSAPWYALPGCVLGLPVWAPRIHRLWRMAGGWTQRYPGRPAIGIKPARLLEQADRTIGRRIFCEEPDVRNKVEHIACHEMAHAVTSHLRLPAWLNEGIAMLAVDRYFGRTTVHPRSLDLVRTHSPGARPAHYRKLIGLGPESIAGQYVRAYWLTRVLDEEHPAVLRGLLQKRMSERAIEGRLTQALGVTRRDLWPSLDRLAVGRFAGVPPCACEG